MAVDREALRVWLEASCASQGVPLVVSDAGVVAQLGVLLKGGGAAGMPPVGGDRSAQPSQSPGCGDPVRVDRAAAVDARGNGREIQHSVNDRSLSGEGQVLPTVPQLLAVADDTL